MAITPAPAANAGEEVSVSCTYEQAMLCAEAIHGDPAYYKGIRIQISSNGVKIGAYEKMVITEEVRDDLMEICGQILNPPAKKPKKPAIKNLPRVYIDSSDQKD